MFRPARSLLSALNRAKECRTLHASAQNLAEATEYECECCTLESHVPTANDISLNLCMQIYCLFVAVITDEYKRGPTGGRALYLDAQATTPLVSRARYNSVALFKIRN